MAAIEGEGLAWPEFPGWDYSHGFPIHPHAARELEGMSDDVAADFLAELEAAAFEALVRWDLAELPLLSHAPGQS